MRCSKLAVVGLLLFFSISAAWADAIRPGDPTMIIVRGGLSDPFNFGFNANSNGGGSFDYINNSGVDWYNLLITTKIPHDSQGNLITDPLQYTIYDQFFSGTPILTFNGDMLSVLFFDVIVSGGSGSGGSGYCCSSIDAGVHFSIILNNNQIYNENGIGGWNPGQSFDAHANVPEPGTYLLLLAGLAGLALAAKLRR